MDAFHKPLDDFLTIILLIFDYVFFGTWFIDNFFRRLILDSLSAVLSQQTLGSTYLKFCFLKILTDFVTGGWKNYNAGGTNHGIGSPT